MLIKFCLCTCRRSAIDPSRQRQLPPQLILSLAALLRSLFKSLYSITAITQRLRCYYLHSLAHFQSTLLSSLKTGKDWHQSTQWLTKDSIGRLHHKYRIHVWRKSFCYRHVALPTSAIANYEHFILHVTQWPYHNLYIYISRVLWNFFIYVTSSAVIIRPILNNKHVAYTATNAIDSWHEDDLRQIWAFHIK